MKIKPDHLTKNADGKVDHQTIELKHTQGHARFLYWTCYTCKEFTDAIRKVRQQEKRQLIHVPHMFERQFKEWMWSWTANKIMRKTADRISSEVLFDLRTDIVRKASLFNQALNSLDSAFVLFKQSPQLIWRQKPTPMAATLHYLSV